MNSQSPTASPYFHEGEIAVQKRAGSYESMLQVGPISIRPFMPDQHRQFFEQIPFVVIGSVDAAGWPWASILTGGAGFMQSPTPTRLTLEAAPLTDDPLAQALSENTPLGLIGIEIGTRRRNRMNANVVSVADGKVALDVVQSFGNCPQYIQTRDLKMLRAPDSAVDRKPTEYFTELDDAAQAFVAQADTFFVSSSVTPEKDPVTEGVDVSHRGGRAGFVKVNGNHLTIPDYAGNRFYNTLGNFLVNPKAGITFPDYATGDVLMLTGSVEILWEDHPDLAHFKGAERGWRFTLDHGMRIHDALPFRAEFEAWSPNSLMTDDWTTAQARAQAEALRDAWRPLRVAAIKDESRSIRSFTFEPVDEMPLLEFEAGQHLTLRITPDGNGPRLRNYTVSSAPGDLPGDLGYRISVKREDKGVVSQYLHDQVQVGDVIDVRAPKGNFYIDGSETRPAALFAGGVGVTPILSMTRHVLNESLRARFTRPLTIFHAAHTTADRAFEQEFRAAAKDHAEEIRYFSVIGAPQEGEKAGEDFDVAGRITAQTIKSGLALDDYDCFLCGPLSFMQGVYTALRSLGVPDARIFAEGFGPATLVRTSDPDEAGFQPNPEADAVVIKFETSGFEQGWQAGDGTLLETAEAHGLSPAFSCRSGSCGSCLTKKLSGEVVYRTPVSAPHSEGEVLICCAVPAADSDTVVLDL